MDRLHRPIGGAREFAGSDPDMLASLVAAGGAPFPADLSPRERQMLAQEVSRRRSDRLLRYIARAIAADISRDPTEKE